MRALVVSLFLLLAGVSAAGAAGPVFDDPRALIEHIYAPYRGTTVPMPEDQTESFSPTLRQLWDAMRRREVEQDTLILDFDPFINAQDYELVDFAVSDPAVDGDKATVVVSFSNYGDPQELHYDLVRRADGWKVDDIESTGDYAWRLSDLLAADPLLN